METYVAKAIVICVLSVTMARVVQSQSLDDYVREGLKSNLVLEQKNISVQQAQQSLKIARSYFLPSISLLTDYTSGQGGRSISIPVGDLLNPVYASLNQMTESNAFAQVSNVEQNFFPTDFYDARIRTSVPLIDTDLLIGTEIEGQKVVLRQYEAEMFQRQLVEDIKTAYYNVIAAEASVKIYESALKIVQKNIDVNQSLLANGKSLPSNLLRSKSEAERVKADLNSSRNKANNARKYFNFLLNRELNSPVNTDLSNTADFLDLGDTISEGIDQREELHIAKIAREINQLSLRMSKLNRLPKVSAFADLGTQAEGFRYNNDSRFYLVGVQLSLPIFQGLRNDRTIRRSHLETLKSEHDVAHTEKRLELAVSVARNQLKTTITNYHAAEQQLKSAQGYFVLLERGYEEGVNSLIEFLDARNELTSSQLQLNLRKLEVLTATAHVERQSASYKFQIE
jgi:outer membrane protein